MGFVEALLRLPGPQAGNDGGDRRDRTSPEQCTAPGMAGACEQGSPSLLTAPSALQALPSPSLGKILCYGGAHWGLTAPSPTLPALKGTLLPAQHNVLGWAKSFSWVERFPLHCQAQAPALQTHTSFCLEWDKVLWGLDSKYRFPEYAKWRRKCLSWTFLYLPDKKHSYEKWMEKIPLAAPMVQIPSRGKRIIIYSDTFFFLIQEVVKDLAGKQWRNWSA